ncbi:MAG: c-type cytochrome [Betaproteobacteria bacterium]|nr:c-type cytochrome [Betaproteobacteria bacterium]
MYKWNRRAAFLFALLAGAAAAQNHYSGVGRPATPAEIAAWDIDVRADFTGLPKGSGTVAQGQDLWDRKCASCHGFFGESNEVFPPVIGGTKPEDVKRGRVASLVESNDQRTTMMKLSRISTLWDYIRRAMPWNEPKSLSVDEVYAVTAYILNMAELVPADYTLNDRNIRDAQAKLPNRDGLRPFPGLSDVRGKPDVKNTACMKDCIKGEARIVSSYPASARDTHGNLAEQNRLVGPVRGVVTIAGAAKSGTVVASAGSALVRKHGCQLCHGITSRVVGPSLREIGQRYAGDVGAAARLVATVRAGGSGNWGNIPMPPQLAIAQGDIESMVLWLLSGAF